MKTGEIITENNCRAIICGDVLFDTINRHNIIVFDLIKINPRNNDNHYYTCYLRDNGYWSRGVIDIVVEFCNITTYKYLCNISDNIAEMVSKIKED